MKFLVMCEGSNELELMRILLEHKLLIFTEDDLLGLTPYHARHIAGCPQVMIELNQYPGPVEVLRIGDKQSDKLKIPKEYESRITSVKKYCTKPELEMLLIIAEGLESEYEKTKSSKSPKIFSKENIFLGKKRYDNSCNFYRDYFGIDPEKLAAAIRQYRIHNGSHGKEEHYLAELLK